VENEKTDSGIDLLGNLSWGTHFCSFFDTKQDLLDLLIPFFRAGLENNEYCLWITYDPITVDEAMQALEQKVPNLQNYIEKQSIEVIPYVEWFIKEGDFIPEKVTGRFVNKLNQALKSGHKGLRVNGCEGWLGGDDKWHTFLDFEQELNSFIFDKRIVALCSYPLEKCKASMVLDVAHVHEMVLSKRNDRWEVLEVPELKKTKAQLKRVNKVLEKRVAERTKELELAVAKLQEEVTARTKSEEELARIATDLIQRSSDLQQFAYIVSHNLRAPIANIIGLLNVLIGNISNAEQSTIHRFLFNSAEKLDEIVKDLNNILQTKHEVTEINETFLLSEMVSNLKSSFGNLIEKENAQILTDFSAIDEITTIKSYLNSILYNLIQNSIRFKHPDRSPVIEIKTTKDAEKIRISIKDNGIGIDMKKHGNKIFGLYKRFHPSTLGKGIGLFMVKTQVEALGGNISINSTPNAGSEFIIELPINPLMHKHNH
jgi:signal transduction histidine kinase